MRSGGGKCHNPTAQELLAEYRKVTVDSLFTHVPGSNCNLDAGEFLVKLHHFQTIPNTPIEIIPFAIFPITNVLDNSIVLIELDICNYIRKYCCTNCVDLICMSASNCFSSNHLLIMDKSKNVYNNNRFQPTTIFVDYVRKLYILFKYYINDIVYKVNICRVFNHIISVNNMYFDYCDNC